MIFEVVAHCASCGKEVDAEIHDDGTVKTDGCFTDAIVTQNENIKEHATRVERYVDIDLPPGCGAVIWTECHECCKVYNNHSPSSNTFK